MIKLSDLGLSKDIDTAQKPSCGAECQNCKHINNCDPKITAENFKSKEEVLGFAVGIANEWDCPHTFVFIKFYDGTCAIAFHELTEEIDGEEIYEWDARKIQWSEVKHFRQYVAEVAEMHFAVVLEEDKNGDFSVITE